MNGELPDMYFILLDNSDLGPMIEYGAIICIEDLIENYTVNMKAALENDPSLHDKVSFIDGKIYAAWEDTMNTLSIYHRMYVYWKHMRLQLETECRRPRTSLSKCYYISVIMI